MKPDRGMSQTDPVRGKRRFCRTMKKESTSDARVEFRRGEENRADGEKSVHANHKPLEYRRFAPLRSEGESPRGGILSSRVSRKIPEPAISAHTENAGKCALDIHQETGIAILRARTCAPLAPLRVVCCRDFNPDREGRDCLGRGKHRSQFPAPRPKLVLLCSLVLRVPALGRGSGPAGGEPVGDHRRADGHDGQEQVFGLIRLAHEEQHGD